MIDVVTRAAFTAFVVVGTALVADGSCAPPPSSGGVAKACDMRVRSGPWVFGSGKAQKISASVHVECDKPPRTHKLEVWLERDVTASGSWLLQSDTLSPARSATAPDASGFDLTTTFGGCITGKWRVMAKATGVDDTGTPFKFNLPDSEARPTQLKCTL